MTPTLNCVGSQTSTALPPQLGVHRIPHFRIRPDPDPTRSITVGSGQIFTGSGSGCNLIRIKAELQISKHQIIKDKKILQFVVMLHHEFLTHLKILHFPDSKYQTFFNILGCHVLCLLTLVF